MRSYISIISFFFLPLSTGAQLVEETIEVNPPMNEIGIGFTILTPSGFYKQHIQGVYPGISLSYMRRVGASGTSPHYLGAELNWSNLQTKRTEPFVLNPDGTVYTFFRYLDPELFTAFGTYKIQPELKAIIWPYLEVGLGCSLFYTVERFKYPGQGNEEDEWVSDFSKSNAVISYRAAIGAQYFIPKIRSVIDLSWRFQYNGLVTYDVIDQTYEGNSTNPYDYFIEKRSRAPFSQFKLAVNYLF
jgi:hypothetical protein